MDGHFTKMFILFETASRRGLVEKSSLIRHASSAKPKRPDGGAQQSSEQRSASAIDSQTLLKDVRAPKEKSNPKDD